MQQATMTAGTGPQAATIEVAKAKWDLAFLEYGEHILACRTCMPEGGLKNRENQCDAGKLLEAKLDAREREYLRALRG